MRTIALLSLTFLIYIQVEAQSCDCPTAGTCSTCSGGISSFTLRFNGSTARPVEAKDQGGTVFSAVVNPGATFTFTGTTPNDKFQGVDVDLNVSGGPNASIPVNCGTVSVGDSFGDFTVVAAQSKTGGALCCSAGVADSTPPQINNCPANRVVNLPTSSCSVAGGWTAPTATDNCTVASFTSDHLPTELLTVGVTTVTYTATDKYNNTSTCSFTVTVKDTTLPVFSNCPADIFIEAASACQAVVSWTPPTASDNCSVTRTSTHNPGSTFSFGTTLVTYTAKDPSGNTSTCLFNVTVRDTTPPVLSNCPADITLEATSTCEAIATWTAPTATDNCSAAITSTHNPGSTFPIGTTAVTYTAADPSGNKSTCSFNIIVKDTTAPVFTNCPANISLTVSACESAATWTPPTVTDSCPTTLVASHQPGNVFPLGTTSVTYTATDQYAHSSTCTFNIIVKTAAAPAISNCPEDQTLHTYDDAVEVSWTEPRATSVCGVLNSASSHQPGDRFNAGVTTVQYEFSDGTNNKSVCSFNVTVIKDEISFEVSRAVTPNGDGINDIWEVTNIEKFKDNTVVVVDRWGNRIYSGTGYDNKSVQWNGNGINGTRVPVGTYFYTVEVRMNGSLVRDTGFVEVIY